MQATIEDLRMTIAPDHRDWTLVKSDVFFDNGQIVVEVEGGLEFNAVGELVDPETGQKE